LENRRADGRIAEGRMGGWTSALEKRQAAAAGDLRAAGRRGGRGIARGSCGRGPAARPECP
jgi:hypothetical protein